jgi:hypothetical protein
MAKRSKEEQKLVIAGQEPAAPAVQIEPLRLQLDFDSWWILTQQRLRLRPELKESVRKHLIARGFMVKLDFDAGLQDFGIKT